LSKHILIVDDEPKVGFFLKESVEALGSDYTALHVQSAEDALSALSQSAYDLVVTDLRMPGMNGLELLSQVRYNSPELPTILITAYGSEDVVAACQHLHPTHYFTKPFRIEDFLHAVQEALTQRLPNSAAEVVEAELARVTQRLQDLRFEVGAHCALIADREGQVRARAGSFEGLDHGGVIATAIHCLMAATDYGRNLREEHALNLSYHEGARFDVYATSMDARLFVVLVFDRRQGLDRIGVVWLYLKRALNDLQSMLLPSDEPDSPAAGWLLAN
jgi:CheY-like chemotaxis protein